MTPLQRLVALTLLVAPLAGLPAAAIPAARAARLQLFPATPALLKAIGANSRAARRIDIAARVRNWGQGGSCVHASVVHLLNWQGRPELAERWRRTHNGGATTDSIYEDLDAAGLDYAQTQRGDEHFLEWCIATRRGANVAVQQAAHMVTLVGLDN